MYKFELNSGKILWNTKTQSTIYDSSPQIFNNRYAILGTTDGELIIIDAENGKMLQKTFLHPSYILTKLIAQIAKSSWHSQMNGKTRGNQSINKDDIIKPRNKTNGPKSPLLWLYD